MKCTTCTLALVFIALLPIGCVPKKRIVWSPDGSRAAVITKQGLAMTDGNGCILPPSLDDQIGYCSWFADGRRLIATQMVDANAWEDIEKILSAERINWFTSTATEVKDRLLAYDGDLDDFEFVPEGKCSTGTQIAIAFYLRHQIPEGLPEKLGEKWEDLEKLKYAVTHLRVLDASDSEISEGQVLTSSLDQVHNPLLSPDERYVLFSADIPDLQDTPGLYVMPTTGGRPRLIASHIAANYDWSPDSRSVAYFSTAPTTKSAEDRLQLGSLSSIRVIGPNDKLLKKWPERQDHAGLLFNKSISVRWMKDGRILFSSVELRLPATNNEMPQQWALFLFDPRMAATITRVTVRDFAEPLDMGIPQFELSPDEKRVLLPGPSGRVALYDFATCQTVALIEEPPPARRCCALPTWRNNSQVCFITLTPGADGKASGDVALWKDGTMRVISKEWPEEMKTGWLVGDD